MGGPSRRTKSRFDPPEEEKYDSDPEATAEAIADYEAMSPSAKKRVADSFKDKRAEPPGTDDKKLGDDADNPINLQTAPRRSPRRHQDGPSPGGAGSSSNVAA